MNAPRTARERVRAELTAEIKESARAQLVERGASELSLRAVARELGMASSAVYRYFPSRDALLTALIIDAYDSLGDAVEVADAGCARQDHAGRWAAICRTVRSWAQAHPHEYALVYGSPVPGYAAPEDTIGPASRIPMAMVRVLADAWADRPGTGTGTDEPPVAALLPGLVPGLDDQLRAGLGGEFPAVPPPVMARAIQAWGGLFGLVSLELFGHLVGSVDDPGLVLDQHVVDSAVLLGLA